MEREGVTEDEHGKNYRISGGREMEPRKAQVNFTTETNRRERYGSKGQSESEINCPRSRIGDHSLHVKIGFLAILTLAWSVKQPGGQEAAQ